MTKYAELRLRIDRGVGRGSYRIVATGPAGEALGRFKLPFSDMELENFILKVGATRRGRRRIDSPEMDLAKTFGTKLFGALFEGDVRELYRSSFSETRSTGHGLRVTLSLTGAPELLQVPWEYMYDHPSFLSISTWTPIVRYLDLPKPRRPLQVALPIRILALVSSPSDAEQIDAAQERAKLEAALAPLIDAGAIAIDWLGEASLRALQRQLRRGEYHVFHFIGHGGYDHDADDGVLLFEDEIGRGRRVSGIQLGTILADEVSLRLAVLNSCEGARSSLQDPFSGVATSLIEREIPAVIGMQFEITDRAAIVFAGEFYSALADGLPVDSSVAEARKAIYADQNDVEWGTPVLFMRVADGRLFDVLSHAPIRAPKVGPTVAAVAAAAPNTEVARPADDVGSEEPNGADEQRLVREEADAVQREHEAASSAAEQLEKERREEGRLAREAADAGERQPAEIEAQMLVAERIEQERLAQEAADAAERQRAETEAQRLETEHIATERAAAADAARVEADRVERQRIELATAERARAADAARLEAGRAHAAAATPDAKQRDALVPTRVVAAAGTAATTADLPEADGPTGAGLATTPKASLGEPELARAAGRAAVGALLTVVAVFVLTVVGGRSDDSTPGKLPGYAMAMTLTLVAVVTLAEGLFPRMRVPDGDLYRALGGRRWAAAAAEGAVVGATFATAGFIWLGVSFDPLYLAVVMAIIVGASFAVAETILGRLFRRQPGQQGIAVAAPGERVAFAPEITRTSSPDVARAERPASSSVASDDGIVVATAESERAAASRRAADAPFSLVRAGARGALGSLIGLAFLWALGRIVTPSNFEGYSAEVLVGGFVNEAALTVLTVTIAVALAEGALRVLRVPGGRAYRIVKGNRWIASGLEGAVAGATVGWLTTVSFYASKDNHDAEKLDSLLFHAAFTALGFIIAEAVIYAFRPRSSSA